METRITSDNGREIFFGMFEKWNDSLHESYLNIQKLRMSNPKAHGAELIEAAAPTADCYTKGAVLYPTVKDGPCTTREAIADYFAHFAEKNPKGTVLDTKDSPLFVEVSFDANGKPFSVNAEGKYIFEMDDGKGGRVNLTCRFSYKIVDENGEHKWAKHSSNVEPSSQTGQKLVPVAAPSLQMYKPKGKTCGCGGH